MAMATIKFYLWYAMFGALIIAFLWLMFEFFMNGQWKFAVLFMVCAPWCMSGFLMALIVGWQEAAKWRVKKLMITYSVIFVICSILYVDHTWKDFTKEREDPAAKKKK